MRNQMGSDYHVKNAVGIGISHFLRDQGSGCTIFVGSETKISRSRFLNQGSEIWVQK